jgi:hypothetical protein
MIATLEAVLHGSLNRLSGLLTTWLPPLFAGIIIMALAWAVALLARWMLIRIFKGIAADRFLRKSGLASMLTRSGDVRTTQLAAGAAYWAVLIVGFLIALSAFNSALTSRMIETMVFLLPKIVTAVLIILGGLWLGQYLSRSALVWAVNEDLPGPRRIAAAVRASIVFVAVVVAADHLDFGRTVFLAAFVLIVGGAVLAASLAIGLAGKDAVLRYLQARSAADRTETAGRSLWNHL